MTFESIIVQHWMADFVNQSREIAVAKSSDNIALLRHVLYYSLHFVLVASVYSLIDDAHHWDVFRYMGFIGINAMLHLVVDYFTSRASTKAYKADDIKRFWNIIGFDQMLHTLCLYVTWKAFS